MNININEIIGKLKDSKYYEMLFESEEASKNYVVFDIGNYNVKFIRFSIEEKIVINEFNTVKLNYSKASDFETALKNAISDILYGKNFEECKIAVIYSGQQITNRFIVIPKIPEEEVETVIKFEMKKLLHLEADQAVINHQIIEIFKDESGKEKYRIFVAVMKSDDVNIIESLFKNAGIPVSILTIDTILVSEMTDIDKSLESKRIGIIDIGAENTNFNIIQSGKIEFSRNIPMGGNAITELIAKDISGSPTNFREFLDQSDSVKKITQIEVKEDELEKLDEQKKIIVMSLTDGISRISQRIRLTIGYFKTQVKGKNIDELYIIGGTSNIPGLESYFSENLDIHTSKISEDFYDFIVFKEEEIMKARFIESSNLYFLSLMFSLKMLKQNGIINFLSKKKDDDLDIDVLVDRFPEPAKIFTIASIIIILYYFALNFSALTNVKGIYSKYDDIKQKITDYRVISEELKYKLKRENIELTTTSKWLETFKTNNITWLDFYKKIGELLPKNSFMNSINIASRLQDTTILYNVKMEMEFVGEDNLKEFRFRVENPSAWEPLRVENIVFKDRPPIVKSGDKIYRVNIEAEVY
ncbi:MAG: pilus assembly protein PilM [Candidatus Muirbacterium halophilum]|nr:pilus assembly protein PilM [Candidatus Muirbacterium halophilum]